MKSAISRIAAHVILGGRIKQIRKPSDSEPKPPTREQIDEARTAARSYAKRMRDLRAARLNMDLAVGAERSLQGVDLATAVAANEDLPDFEAVESNARRAKIHVKAVHQLACREADFAGQSIGIVRADSLRLAEAAKAAIIAKVAQDLPSVFENPEEIARISKPAKHAARMIFELEAQAHPLRLVNAALFGKTLPPYRIDEMPQGNGVYPGDQLQPDAVATEIERMLERHDQAAAFLRSLINGN